MGVVDIPGSAGLQQFRQPVKPEAGIHLVFREVSNGLFFKFKLDDCQGLFHGAALVGFGLEIAGHFINRIGTFGKIGELAVSKRNLSRKSK